MGVGRYCGFSMVFTWSRVVSIINHLTRLFLPGLLTRENKLFLALGVSRLYDSPAHSWGYMELKTKRNKTKTVTLPPCLSSSTGIPT